MWFFSRCPVSSGVDMPLSLAAICWVVRMTDCLNLV
jgi:hypothetical protein